MAGEEGGLPGGAVGATPGALPSADPPRGQGAPGAGVSLSLSLGTATGVTETSFPPHPGTTLKQSLEDASSLGHLEGSEHFFVK